MARIEASSPVDLRNCQSQISYRCIHNCVSKCRSISRSDIDSNIRLEPDPLERRAIGPIRNPTRHAVLPPVGQGLLCRVSGSTACEIAEGCGSGKNCKREDQALGSTDGPAIRQHRDRPRPTWCQRIEQRYLCRSGRCHHRCCASLTLIGPKLTLFSDCGTAFMHLFFRKVRTCGQHRKKDYWHDRLNVSHAKKTNNPGLR